MTEAMFWMVWRPGGDFPAKRHSERLSAISEAKRLALKHPEESFYVLSADVVVRTTQPVEVIELNDLPF